MTELSLMQSCMNGGVDLPQGKDIYQLEVNLLRNVLITDSNYEVHSFWAGIP